MRTPPNSNTTSAQSRATTDSATTRASPMIVKTARLNASVRLEPGGSQNAAQAHNSTAHEIDTFEVSI
jgi:hypothetical protein